MFTLFLLTPLTRLRLLTWCRLGLLRLTLTDVLGRKLLRCADAVLRVIESDLDCSRKLVSGFGYCWLGGMSELLPLPLFTGRSVAVLG